MQPKGVAQRKISYLFIAILALALVSFLWLVGYIVYQKTQNPPELYIEFNQNFNLQVGQTATLGSGSETIKFRFTELKPPSNPDARCEELCSQRLPTIMSELEYAGKTLKGTSASETGIIDMSYEENGAYPLVPYIIELVGADLNKGTATVKITQKQLQQVELGMQFTLEDDGVAALVPARTGVHIRFGSCGYDSSCIQDVDLYVDGEYIDTTQAFTTPELQFASDDGAYIAHDGIRLRLVESDDHTYATFVFEKL